MFRIESYRDVLSENGQGNHIIASGWLVAAVITVALVLFA